MVCYLGGAFYPKWVCGAGMCGDGMLEKWLLRLDSSFCARAQRVSAQLS